jgi:succinoglycan biosynthesis transport protein ExoP
LPAPGDLLSTVWRRRVSFLLLFVVTFAAATAITLSLPKRYTSTGYLLVRLRSGGGSDFEGTQQTQMLTRTYAELMQSKGLNDDLRQVYGRRVGGGHVKVTAVPDSQLLAVEGTANSPTQAKVLTDAYSRLFQGRVADLVAAKRTSGEVAVAQPGDVPDAPSSPRLVLYLSFAAIAAAFIAAAGAAFTDRIDRRLFVSPEDWQLGDTPILGRLAPSTRDPGALSDAAHTVLSNLALLAGGDLPHTVAVVSAQPGEGRTTVAMTVARAASERGLGVLVVEADLRRPVLAEQLAKLAGTDPPADIGLTALLENLDEPIENHLFTLHEPFLHLLPAGRAAQSPAAVLRPEWVEDVHRRLRERFDFVVYDMPALSAGAEVLRLSMMADARLVVVDATRSNRDLVRQAIAHFGLGGTGVTGVVINRFRGGVTGLRGDLRPRGWRARAAKQTTVPAAPGGPGNPSAHPLRGDR